MLLAHGNASASPRLSPFSLGGNVSAPHTISLQYHSLGLFCLDVPMVAQGQLALLQLWECNGHANQLFFFDPGSWRIQSAIDPSLCLDSTTVNPKGTTFLKLWGCNGTPEQQFGYNSDGLIYLKLNSKLCIDVFFPIERANKAQIAACNTYYLQQKFDVNLGTTIRVNKEANLCLDAGKAQKGALVQAWPCNGHSNQQWWYDPQSGALRSALGPSSPALCLDAFDTKAAHQQLQLWDCNQFAAQQWGYDPAGGTIYLRESLPVSGANARFCLDLWGGNIAAGTNIGSAYCDNCWNQKWVLGVQHVGASWGRRDELQQVAAPMAPWQRTPSAIGTTRSRHPPASMAVDAPRSCPAIPGSGSVPHTISLRAKDKGLLCIDVPGALAQKASSIDLWECNGHTNQLFLFDPGTWRIQYAADPTVCLDAGGNPKAGSGVMLWPCNGLAQQRFGYDGKAGRVYLKDTSLCIDVFSSMSLGNKVQMWTCNSAPQQVLDVNWGTSIRVNQQYNLCLDLIVNGGSAAKGNHVQSWPCNGNPNQQWIYDPVDGAIYTGLDAGKKRLCLDAYDSAKGYKQIQVWDCNQQRQQKWGYDANMMTIYLQQSLGEDALNGSQPEPNAGLCLDLFAGSLAEGNAIGTWNCNGCWNQKFILGGGVQQRKHDQKAIGRSASRRTPTGAAAVWHNASAAGSATLGSPLTCPPVPGPKVDNCADGFPRFSSAALLQNSNWGKYINEIYGGIPQDPTLYPWCMGDLWMLYQDRISAYKITKLPKVTGTCPSAKGKTPAQLYQVNNQFQPSNSLWIWHTYPFPKFEDNTWVEVTHMSGLGDEHAGMWFFYAKGSGLWFNLGKTHAFSDHADAYTFIGAHNNEDMARKFQAQGYDSIQFLAHTDCEFKQCNGQAGTRYMNYEIVSTKLEGVYSCGSSDGQSALVRKGWMGSQPCKCNNKQNNLNCEGVPVQPVKPMGGC
jgi:hypothetical protein